MSQGAVDLSTSPSPPSLVRPWQSSSNISGGMQWPGNQQTGYQGGQRYSAGDWCNNSSGWRTTGRRRWEKKMPIFRVYSITRTSSKLFLHCNSYSPSWMGPYACITVLRLFCWWVLVWDGSKPGCIFIKKYERAWKCSRVAKILPAILKYMFEGFHNCLRVWIAVDSIIQAGVFCVNEFPPSLCAPLGLIKISPDARSVDVNNTQYTHPHCFLIIKL